MWKEHYGEKADLNRDFPFGFTPKRSVDLFPDFLPPALISKSIFQPALGLEPPLENQWFAAIPITALLSARTCPGGRAPTFVVIRFT
jgi:hypothetical protein